MLISWDTAMIKTQSAYENLPCMSTISVLPSLTNELVQFILRICKANALQGKLEISDICLASAFSKARFGLRKPIIIFLVL